MKESEFIRLVMPLRDRMFRYAQSLVLSSAEAEDVVHDLLERMWSTICWSGCGATASGWSCRSTSGLS